MENQQVSTQENAVQQHEGQVEGFGQHPLDSGGMGDANGGAPPMTPPPLDLGGPEAVAPVVRTMSPNFSISESGDVHSGVSSPVATQQPSTDPYQGESGMLQSGQNDRAMSSSGPATETSSQFDTFKTTANTNYGVLLTIDTVDTYITNLRTAVEAANNPDFEYPVTGVSRGSGPEYFQNFGLELASDPVDVTDGGDRLWYPDQGFTSPRGPIDLAPMETEIGLFTGHFDTLTTNLSNLNASVTSSSWEDTLLLLMQDCELSASESLDAFNRLSLWVEDNFLAPSLSFPVYEGLIDWELTEGSVEYPLEEDFLSSPGTDYRGGGALGGFPGANTDAIRTSLDAFSPLETQMTGISNDGTDDQVQALIERDTPENRTKRIAFRDQVNTTHGVEYDVIDLIFDHLIENGVDPADQNAYNIVIGNGGDVQGTAGMDIIIAGPGTSTVDALGGDDFIYSSGEGAVVFSGAGDDTVHVAGENTVVDGGTGSDTVNTNGGGTTVIDREDQDQVSGLSEGESALGNNEDIQGEADRESFFGQTKWGLIDEFANLEPYDYFEGQLEGFVQTLNYELSLQVEAANALEKAQQIPHFQQAIENAIALQMSQMSSMLLLGSQVPLAVGGARDFFRLAAARAFNIGDRLTLRMHQAVGVAAAAVAAQSLEQEEAPPMDERLNQLQVYITDFNTQYQGLMNQMTLLQLVPHDSNWEAGLIAEINAATTAVSSLQSQFDLIKGVPTGFGLDILSTGKTMEETYAALYGSIQADVVTSLGSSLGTEQSKLQGLLNKDSAGQRAWRVDFRDRISTEYSLDFDTIDIIFDFLIANDIDPLTGDYTIRVANGGVIQGDEGIDILVGSEGDDVMNGGGGNDLILGMGGDDYIRGEEGHDTIYGGDGNDRIEGGEDNDTLSGGSGNDLIIGNGGMDTFDGGEGEDLLHHEAGETHDGENGEAMLDEPDHQAASGAGLAVVDITQETFVPGSLADAQRIDAADANGIWVPVSLGELFEEATIPVYSTVNGYQTPEGASSFIKAVNYPLTSVLGDFLDYGVRVGIVDNAIQIEAETRIAGTEIPLSLENLDTALQHAGINLDGLDFEFGESNLDLLVFNNFYANGSLNFELINIPLQIGEYVQGTAQIGYLNGGVYISGQLGVDLGDGASGFIELTYEGGILSGSANLDVNFGDVSGSMDLFYNTGGVNGLAGRGTGQINTDKLNAELDLFFGPSEWVDGHVQSKIDSMQVGQTAGELPSPDIQGIPEDAPNGFSWAGIATGTVPISPSFDAMATGILDSGGDYILNLSIGQTSIIPLTEEAHEGSWGLHESYPVVDFGIPLLADVSANVFAGLDFTYIFGEIELSGASLSGTYAKAGNKYGIANSIDLGGTLSLNNLVTLAGTLGLGISEHIFTQSGQIRLDATLEADIEGNSSAEADIRAEMDEDGFHPHFNTVIDMSQALKVKLFGSFFAQNKIKHFFKHDSTQTVEIVLGGVELGIGQMDLEMGYNSDAEENRFSFGPPEGQDRIFQISSIEDMIENMQTLDTSVTTEVDWVETTDEGGNGGADAGGEQGQDGGEDDGLLDFRNEPIPDEASIESAIASLGSHVQSAAPLNFELPDYGDTYEMQVKTYKVLQALEDIYSQDDSKLEDDTLTEADANALAGHIRLSHSVFEEFKVVDDDEMVDSDSFTTPQDKDYWAYEWRASPTEGAPAAEKASLEVFRQVEDLTAQANVAVECVQQAIEMLSGDPGLTSTHFAEIKSSSNYMAAWVTEWGKYIKSPGTINNFLYTSYGYAVETIACFILNTRKDELGPYTPIFQAARGHSRPDIILVDGENKDRAWLDITSDASAGHIYQKQSSGWNRKEFVAEILYPQLVPAVLASNSGTLNPQQINALNAASEAQAADQAALDRGKTEATAVLETQLGLPGISGKAAFESALLTAVRGMFDPVPGVDEPTRADARSVLLNMDNLTIRGQSGSGASWANWMRKGANTKRAGERLLIALGNTIPAT